MTMASRRSGMSSATRIFGTGPAAAIVSSKISDVISDSSANSG